LEELSLLGSRWPMPELCFRGVGGGSGRLAEGDGNGVAGDEKGDGGDEKGDDGDEKGDGGDEKEAEGDWMRGSGVKGSGIGEGWADVEEIVHWVIGVKDA